MIIGRSLIAPTQPRIDIKNVKTPITTNPMAGDAKTTEGMLVWPGSGVHVHPAGLSKSPAGRSLQLVWQYSFKVDPKLLAKQAVSISFHKPKY
eukprot:767620-Hanusia_phi.AAC.5